LAVELNRDNYEIEILQHKGVALVDFWGPQCRPCLALMPAVEQIEKDNAGKLKVGKVNSSENRMLCVKQRVMTLPTFILYKNGLESTRLTGQDLTADKIKTAVANMF
jgi:thioredoxin 1